MDQLAESEGKVAARTERWCVWVVYGAPMFFAAVSISVVLISEGRLGWRGPVGWQKALFSVNAVLAGFASAAAEVSRRGTLRWRVLGGVLGFMFGLLLSYVLCSVFAVIIGL